MSKLLGFLLVVTILLYHGNCMNWQGIGNMTQDNMTQIRAYINTNFNTQWTMYDIYDQSDGRLTDFASSLSNHLNSKWNQAWNVVVAYTTGGFNSDTVLYGYAFRDHWMWINGVTMADGKYIGFVIWKDYNCITWTSINSNTIMGFYQGSYSDSSSIKTVIQGLYSKLSQDDIWLSAKKYADSLESDSGVKAAFGADIAFTIIMSQNIQTYYYARFCSKNYLLVYKKVGQTGGDWGKALILQMR